MNKSMKKSSNDMSPKQQLQILINENKRYVSKGQSPNNTNNSYYKQKSSQVDLYNPNLNSSPLHLMPQKIYSHQRYASNSRNNSTTHSRLNRSTQTSQLIAKQKDFYQNQNHKNNAYEIESGSSFAYIKEIGALERRRKGRSSFYKRIGIEKDSSYQNNTREDIALQNIRNSTNIHTEKMLWNGREEGVRFSEPTQSNIASQVKEDDLGVEDMHCQMVRIHQKSKRIVMN